MPAGDTIITISDVLEYLFCPRFIYFIHCLAIPQHEESRFKVIKGREVHDEKRITNTEYLRKKPCVVKRELQDRCEKRFRLFHKKQ
jgi:CRISPR-associated exonuclease Cas4